MPESNSEPPSRTRPHRAWNIRKRLGFLVIIAGLLWLLPGFVKREIRFRFVLPEDSERLGVKIIRDGAVYRGIDVQLPDAVAAHEERLELMPGSYQIEATLNTARGPRLTEKSVELPEDSPVEIRF